MQTVKLQLESPVATLTLARPAVHNAFNEAMLTELCGAVDTLEADRSIRVAIIVGDGDKAFSAGGDIGRMAEMSADDGLRFRMTAHRLLERIEVSRVIFIAAINGHALGGGLELALACDIRIVAEQAKLGLPELSVGLIPGWGGMQRLVRAVGVTLAKDMVFASRPINGVQAVQQGLASRSAPAADVLSEALTLAAALAAVSPVALVQAKKAINYGRDMALGQALAYDVECAQINFASPNRVEGLRAYLEKRAPTYRDR